MARGGFESKIYVKDFNMTKPDRLSKSVGYLFILETEGLFQNITCDHINAHLNQLVCLFGRIAGPAVDRDVGGVELGDQLTVDLIVVNI